MAETLEEFLHEIQLEKFIGWSEHRQYWFALDGLKTLPHRDRKNAYDGVLASNAFKGWSEHRQYWFAWQGLGALPLRLRTVFAAAVDENKIYVAAPRWTINSGEGIVLVFDNVRGAGTVSGMYSQMFARFEEWYWDDWDRSMLGVRRAYSPEIEEKFAFAAQQVLDHYSSKISRELAQKITKRIAAWAPNGISDEQRAQFEESIPITFVGNAPATN